MPICGDLHFVGGNGWRQAGNDGAATDMGVDGAERSVQDQSFSPDRLQQTPVVQVIPQALGEVRIH